jgi:hypothetical protein
MIADGMSEAETLSAYPDLERGVFAKRFAMRLTPVRERELPLILP